MTHDKQFVLNAASTAANMLDGMGVSGNTAKWKAMHDSIEDYGMGFVELTQWLADMGYYSTAKLQAGNPQNFPGVYDYEVSYEFGAWVYDELTQRGMPGKIPAYAKIDELAEAFFAKDES